MKLMNSLFILILSLVLTNPLYAAQKDSFMNEEKKWFINNDFERLEILFFKHAIDQKPTQSKVILDKQQIIELIDKITQLPVDGDLFISFTPHVEFTSLIFKKSDRIERISIYGQKIQTPGTSFIAGQKNAEQQEKEIIALLTRLLQSD
jgi:hypothetical protein